MARKPSRRSALSSSPDAIFESRGLVDRKVSQKLAGARKPYTPERLKGLMETLRNDDIKAFADAQRRRAQGKRDLRAKQKSFITNYVLRGMNAKEAAREAGYGTKGAGTALLNNPRVVAAVRQEQELYARAKNITRERVIDEMYEAYDMAKVKGDPLSMIAAVREVGKICGLYEPIKHKLEVSVEGQVVMQQLTVMSDQDLLDLVAKAQALTPPIEGQFTQLPPTARTSASHIAPEDEES